MCNRISAVPEGISTEYGANATGHIKWLLIWKCDQRCYWRLKFCSKRSRRQIGLISAAIHISMDGKFHFHFQFHWYILFNFNFLDKSKPEMQKRRLSSVISFLIYSRCVFMLRETYVYFRLYGGIHRFSNWMLHSLIRYKYRAWNYLISSLIFPFCYRFLNETQRPQPLWIWTEWMMETNAIHSHSNKMRERFILNYNSDPGIDRMVFLSVYFYLNL